ncbi:IucA/IucC family protein [Streptomyces sp. NPDC089424]|uniref:IucA/IucC family protein n=1 Tax=Streptomyces sp. NPDC089424 TaxID=3365917 RepID=UPI00381F7D4A
MTTAPTPDDCLRTPAQRRDGYGTEPVPTAATVPGQHRDRQEPARLDGTVTDLLDHPDAHTAAEAATVENLLRCWVRETNHPAPAHDTLLIPLPATGTALLAPVRYWSRTGWHRFGPPRPADAPADSPPLDAVTVAALLARETPGDSHASAHGHRDDRDDLHNRDARDDRNDHDDHDDHDDYDDYDDRDDRRGRDDRYGHCNTDLVARVADSVRRVATFIGERGQPPTDEADLFLAAEQALLLGHPLHPTPKSREGLTETEARLWSPEQHGAFSLHWMAVAPSLLATDSAWTERGRVVPAARLAAHLAGAELPLPDGYTALPLHPWQARELRHRDDVGTLLDAGLLRDLGVHGPAWHPTSSVRTVYRGHAPAMLKLSLGLHITNSRRENLRKELHRGAEVHRLLRTGLAQQWQAAHPGFDVVRDPAWLAVDGPDGNPVNGLDVVIRHNPFTPTDDVSCLAGLTAPLPQPYRMPRSDRPQQSDRLSHRSRLAGIVTGLAARTGRLRAAVAAEWFLRYLEHVVRPVLWLDGEAGIALEAHQQNTLVLLDSDGWPAGGRYRDNQGFYFRESRRAELASRLPGIGERSDTFVADEVADERFAYYLAINNVFGLIGAFGSQRLADEGLLLAAFRRFLERAASGPVRLRTSLPSRLLDSPVLRCKANLLTRLHGLDELAGPVDTQSVYVTIANPLRP